MEFTDVLVVGVASLLETILTNDPMSPILLLIGALLVGLPMAIFGYLTLGAVIDAIMPDRTATKYP